MDPQWERREAAKPQQQQQQNHQPRHQLPQHQQEEDAWESNSSDESSLGDYEGADMIMMPQPDIDIDDDSSVYDFPRDDLAVLLDGLNKYPWTVYPIQLTNCLTSAGKIASLGIEETCSEHRRLQTLYRDAVPSAFDKCLDDKAIWKWNDEIHNNIFEALCRLMDLVVAKLPQAQQEGAIRMDELLPLLRSLSIGFDKQSQYHVKHKEQSRLSVSFSASVTGQGATAKFAKPLLGSSALKKNGDCFCPQQKGMLKETETCDCSRCRPADSYCWVSYLLNYFGQTAYGNGYQQLLRVLSSPHNLLPALLEVVLLIVAKSAEFLTDDVAELFADSSNKILQYVAEKLESDVDALSDKTKDGSFSALSSILQHLQTIIARNTSPENAEKVVSIVQRKLVERMLSFHSFNKQLSAVREINKMLENVRAVASMDNAVAISTAINWMEKMDIVRQVLRSHLHHKQYVDQVKKIMRFLLQEKRLSEAHLDAVWAATEKPDQFEAVKANIFDLIADLAWSFSPEQWDSLFGRFENCQGQSAFDTAKLLTLVKKLARSDNKGAMASRLLELLWKLMLLDDAPGEILESGAFTEILGHYDSRNCASKDLYIARCLSNIKDGKLVISSFKLLRSFIWLDHDKPAFQMRLQQLIKDHDLLNMLVSSLETYMAGARVLFSANGSAAISIDVSSSYYSHDEHLKERLEFLLFTLRQSSGISLPWNLAERLWNCIIEFPTCEGDRESGFYWFCEALDKCSLLTLDAQTNILTKKLPMIDPSSLSQAAWRCFLRLFLWVNQSKEKLKLTPLDEPVIHDLDLVGLPYLWWIPLCSLQESIVDQSITLLREIHTSLCDALRENTVEIRQRFIDKCLELLEKASEVGGMKWSEGSDCSSTASCSMGEGTSEGTEKLDDKDFGAAKMVEGETVPERRGLSTGARVCSEAHQVEHSLRILRFFIISCEGRCLRSIPPHTASFQGRPFILGVSTANKQSTRFDVAVHTNEYLSSLRAKVAKLLDQPCSRIRLTYQNRDLLHDSQVLWQCGLTGGQTITALVNLVDRASKISDEKQLPGLLISKNVKVYDTLFRLAIASNTSVREGANNLLALLPTHPSILAGFQELCAKSAEEGRSFLTAHFGVRERLLYILQVLDGLVIPVNRPVDLQTLKFRTSFINAGGVQLLLSILEPEALPEGVDNETRRGCYASSLRLLKFLISERFDSNASSLCVSEVTDARDDGITEDEEVLEKVLEGTGASCQACKGRSEQLGEKELSNVVDMASVVAALRRITWAAAVGQLSMMGSCSPMSSAQKIPHGKSAKKRAFPDDDERGLDPEDQYLCFEAMEFLMLCLSKHKCLWRLFFGCCDTEHFIVALLLHSPDKNVRYRAAVNIMKLCATRQGKDSVAHKHVLAALLGAKAEASQHPKRCSHFWELLAHLFCTIEYADDRELAKQQLEDELQWLQSASNSVDDDDRLLEGHLHFLRVLVEVIGCRKIGAVKCKEGRGLIKLLIRDFLFPDSAILLHEEDGTIPGKVMAPEAQLGMLGVLSDESSLLQAKCSTRGSREKAFQLLLCLSTHCKESFQEAVDLIKRIHLTEQVMDWEHLPSYGRKALGGYVGLKNAGATCYMNSVFQQLFMQPEVRRSVLACTECDDVEKAGSVFFQLQAMFGALLGSSLDHYTPQGFWCAYRDYDGMPINLREHQDAFEFFNRLYDAIDETLKATHQETTLTRIFGGVFAQQIICRGCPHRSEREEPFAAISVDVKNKRDLIESLEAFVRGDLLEGDNAYHCAECRLKVDALKRVCVKSLPHTLVIHLKRFDFDYETMQRLKLKDRFEFPTHLDMKPYTVEGLALREMQTHSGLSPKGIIETSDMGHKMDDAANLLKSDSYYHYDLVGVVVHSGTAFAGHYYSYIKQRPGDHPPNCGHSQNCGWIAFDDKNVEPYDAKDMEKDCFGGKYTVDVYDNFLKTTAPQEFDRPNSAYMLLYEKAHMEPFSACSPVQTTNSLSRAEDEDGDEPMKEVSLCERLPSLRNIQMPASVHRSVWQENLRFIHENHLMDKDYFRFILRLVEVNYDVLDKNTNCQQRRVSMVNERLGCLQSANDEEELLDATMVNDFVKIMTTLAIEFLFKIYLRTHSSLREDLVLWKPFLCKLFERSRISCQTFIEALVEHRHWIQDYLIRCPVEEIQQFFASVLLQALRYAVLFSHSTPNNADVHRRITDPLHVNLLIDILLSFLRDPTLPKYSCHQYFQVILEYANLGAAERFYLLNKSALTQLVNTTVIFASKVNFQVAKLDFGYLHSLVSLLLRSCDISQLQCRSVIGSERISSDKEETTDTLKSLPLTNPFQLPPPHFLLPKEAIEAVFNQRVYIAVLIETCSEYEDAVKLLEFLCWNNESFTMWVLQDLIDSLHRAANNDLKPLLALVFKILLLEDSLQKVRHKIILLGHEGTGPGVMSLIVTRVMNIHKRYMLLKFVVKLLSAYPDNKLHLRERASDWKRVVDWLQEEIQSHGLSSNAMITLSVSNEDMSNGHLQRTSSAEWTLVNARSFSEA